MSRLYESDSFYFVPKRVNTKKANICNTSDLLTQNANDGELYNFWKKI